MTNPMTTTGDTIYSSSGSTPARLGIGSTGQVLTVAAGVPSWATPASGLTFASAATSGEQTTSSTSYTDLSTVTSVTLTTGTKALVFINSQLRVTEDNYSYVSVAVSGASTVAASDAKAIINYGQQQRRYGCAVYLSSLTAGSNTFTLKYKTGAGTGAFVNREITVIDLGS
jgi:hypothetical protein